ncbi:hypothetical protein B0H17DRAFT_933441, partial [Mycena rosella]
MVQRFPVNQRDPPALHKPLVKCLNKYGISFATVNPSQEVLRMMPLWHHPGEDNARRQENNGKHANCLRGKHDALTVGAGLDIAQRLTNPLHSNRATRVCDDCDADRTLRGCADPHACAKKAASRLRQLQVQWIP